jgi:hypothetical protein
VNILIVVLGIVVLLVVLAILLKLVAVLIPIAAVIFAGYMIYTALQRSQGGRL